jgi:8-oxo-dGTP pyrophosphatase MutT (NUDIX family)
MKDQISNCLNNLQPRNLADGFTREAAVLIPIFDHNGEPHFLLTRRTEHVETHKGHISFPGGMRQGNEELLTTALRETVEEVGIEESRIELLGRFHDYFAVTGFRVTPFVAYVHVPFTLKPQVREVAEVIKAPLRIFKDPTLLRVEKSLWLRREINVYSYDYGGHQIWGLTAQIIKDFLEAVNLARQ